MAAWASSKKPARPALSRRPHPAIYEGTTAIQANDLVGRKTVRDGGAVAKGIIAQVRQTVAELQGDAQLQPIAARLADAADALEQVVDYVVANVKSDIKAVFAGSVPYLKLAGVVLGGWQMARAAAIGSKLKSGEGDSKFYEAKLATARFYAEQILPQALAYRTAIVDGGAAVMALAEEQF
jgi:butyryl-CoA dehydrogenase